MARVSPMTSSDPCAHDHGDDADGRAQRARQRLLAVRHVFIVTLVLNAVVAISKAVYSYTSGSIALGADSLHSVLDGSSNVLALLGLHWSAAPASPRHPYGRRKIEILVALGIGVLIVIGLYEFAEVAIKALIGHARPPQVGWGGFVLGTMVVNFFVTRYEHRKAHELHSHLLHADAQHTQSDLFASGAVVLSFIAVRNGWPWADGVAGLILVLLVGRVAWIVFRENVPVLLDAAVLDPEGVADLARLVPGIASIHSVRSRGIRSAVELDLHMEVASEMSVAMAHDLAVRIERDVKEKFPEVSDVVIHVEPCLGAASGTEKIVSANADDKPPHRHRDPHSHS
jgi:cation diffusion facilitator family transporter